MKTDKKINEKKEALKEAYIEADKDPGRLRTIEDWTILDDENWDGKITKKDLT
jgi:hypothetical protein